MSGFIAGAQRNQVTLFPETLEDYVAEDSAARVVDVFVDELWICEVWVLPPKGR
jgi:transposase